MELNTNPEDWLNAFRSVLPGVTIIHKQGRFAYEYNGKAYYPDSISVSHVFHDIEIESAVYPEHIVVSSLVPKFVPTALDFDSFNYFLLFDIPETQPFALDQTSKVFLRCSFIQHQIKSVKTP